MNGVSAGHNIIVASHGATIIEGTYVDQRAITIVVPADADREWLNQVAVIFGLGARPLMQDVQHFARFEAQLGIAAQRLTSLEDGVGRKRVHIPHDLAGLRGLQQEVENRIAVIAAERVGDFHWLADAPSSTARLTGFRLQREVYGLTPARFPSIRTRFSDGRFVAFYAACDITAALFETLHYREHAIGPLDDYVFVGIETQFQRLLDLRKPETREFIDTHSPGFFHAIVARGNWSWSQQFGAALVSSGFDGCICPSPISVGRHIIVHFAENLMANAFEIKQIERYTPR